MNTIDEKQTRMLIPNLVTDIGSSLGGTLSATQALLNGAVQDTELRRDLLRGMEHELHYLRFLFENWIMVQFFKTQKVKQRYQKTNLSEWLITILPPWQKIASEKKLQWIYHFAEKLPAIYLDPDFLSQALGNIIYASISCAPPSSTIMVEAIFDQSMVKIKISDSGPRINPLIIFDAQLEFQKYENHPRLQKGLGLGLVLANRIILMHKGEMVFDDSDQLNFCVSIQLPL